MKTKDAALFFLFIFLPSSIVYACSCVAIETFCETITYGGNGIWPDLIVYGEKTADRSDGMEIKVLSVIHGTENRASIFVNAGNGANCGENTNRFAVGKRFVFALIKSNFFDLDPNDYWLSVCGVNFLEVNGANIVGPIAPNVRSIPLTKFNTLSNCGNFNPILSVEGNLSFKIYPNPADQFFNIEFLTDKKIEGDLRIFDATGRFIRKWAIEAESGDKVVQTISDLSPGLYFLEINALEQKHLVKIVVQN